MDSFSDFTRLYSLQRTLCFELKPVPREGETQKEALSRLKFSRFFANDMRRENAYAEVKSIIDDFFKSFIDSSLRKLKINWGPLAEALEQRDEKQQKKISDKIRKEIVEEAFGSTKEILGKDLFEKIIPAWLEMEVATQKITEAEKAQKLEKLSEFKGITTYFSGFWENRKNIFSDKEQHTAIAFRIVNENFPRFYENIKVFKKAPQEIQDVFNDRFPVALSMFNDALTQNGIDTYNAHIGGERAAQSGKEKGRGFNEEINLWNQKHPGKKAPKMKRLYKQILSDRESAWSGRLILCKQDLSDRLKNLYEQLFVQRNDKGETAIKSVEQLLSDLPTFDFLRIWLSEKNVPAVALAIFGQWDALHSELKISTDDSETNAKNEKLVSFDAIETAIRNVRKNYELSEGWQPIDSFSEFLGKVKISTDAGVIFMTFTEVAIKIQRELEDAIRISEQEKELIGDEERIAKIKSALDGVMIIFHKVKILTIREKTLRAKDIDSAFYAELDEVFAPFSSCPSVYDSVRNYLTKKPYSTEKMKLCFDNGKLAGGWVDSYTEKSQNGTQYGAYIFRKKNFIGEYDYFLGISKDTSLFSSRNEVLEEDRSTYERFDYYQPKLTSIFGSSYRGTQSYAKDKEELVEFILSFSEKNGYKIEGEKNNLTPNTCIKILKEAEGDIFAQLLCDSQFKQINTRIIENLKKTLSSYVRVPRLKALANEHFDLFSDLIDRINQLSKEKSFRFFSISQKEFDTKMNDTSEKSFWLFKIQNKDLSYAESSEKLLRKNRGIPNLHTLYFTTLFQENQNVFDIGTGEIFFRNASLNISDSKRKIGHHYDELKDKFSYPIISNRRYTEDKLLFHLSININYLSDKNYSYLNKLVQEKTKKHEFHHVIGIDRGERNLITYSIINLQGKIISQGSFNIISNTHGDVVHDVNYQQKLKTREDERQNARKSWKTIGKIAELKEGYISQVVHAISKLIVEHNAIVVLEDLNVGFKRGRSAIERQVYQKFERALIEKLNLLVFKDRKADVPGGVLNALQLTNKFESFEKLGTQTGVLFYVPAGYTSKIDPTTGFVNIFDLSSLTNTKTKKEFFSKFSRISYSQSEDAFVFEFDYSKFKTFKQPIAKKQWKIYTIGQRLIWNSKTRTLDTKTPTKMLKDMLDFAGIDWIASCNLVESIAKVSEDGCFRREFWDKLFRVFKYTLQMRNSIPNSTKADGDYLISPVKAENGKFFDSREEAKKKEQSIQTTLPIDADSNGAYHIALKGLMGIRKKFVSGWQKNENWFKFVQEREFEY